MAFFESIEGILSIIIMIIVGYILTEKGWLNEEISKTFSKIVCNLSLPCLMLWDLMSNFDKTKLTHLSKGLIIPILSISLSYVVAIIISKLIKVEKNKLGTFRSMFFVSNTIFIGLPVNMALFGEKSVPYVLLYYIANTTFFWTIGVYGISKDGNNDNKASILSFSTLKRIVSPPLLGFILALIFIMLNVHLPSFILDTCKYFGNLTTPLSMLFIGIIIHSVRINDVKLTKDMLFILIGRFLVSPILVVFLSYFYPVPLLMKKVFIMQAAMPVMTNTSIVAKEYGGNYKYATVMTVITTVLSMIVIPMYMLLI